MMLIKNLSFGRRDRCESEVHRKRSLLDESIGNASWNEKVENELALKGKCLKSRDKVLMAKVYQVIDREEPVS